MTTLLPTPAACLTVEAWQPPRPSRSPRCPKDSLARCSPTARRTRPSRMDRGKWLSHPLNGSQRQPLGVRDGSFSPDGAKLAYSLIDGGILIRDLTTGEDLPPGTALGDFNPVWSPDGAQIVFNRGMGIFDLFIVNLDGSNLRQITHGGGMAGGLAARRGFLYTVPGREYEYIVYRLDLCQR